MRLRYIVAMLGIAIGTSLLIAPRAQAAVVENLSIPISLSLTNPCNGDTVDVAGSVHELTAITINGNSFSFVSQANPQGVSGIDETTGAKYQGTGVTTENFGGSFVNGQFQQTFVNRFDFSGQGSAPNFTTHETSHVTINANGTVTASFDDFSVSCG